MVAATSNVESERLGEVLYRYGALTRQQVVAVTLAAVTPEVRFGEAAVRVGFITREQLYQFMSRQTEAIVFAVLLVGDGMFFFLDGYDDDRISARQNLSVNGLHSWDGVRRMDEMRSSATASLRTSTCLSACPRGRPPTSLRRCGAPSTERARSPRSGGWWGRA